MANFATRLNNSKFISYFEIRAYPPYLGLSLAFCWTYSIQRIVPNALGGYMQIAVFAGTAFACFALFLASQLAGGTNCSSKRPLLFLGPGIACLNALALIIPNPLNSNAVAILALSFLCGLSIGWLYVLWSSFYCRLSLRQAIACLFASVIVASIVKVIIAALAVHVTGAAACAALPILSVFCWHRAQKNPPLTKRRKVRYSASTLFTLKRLSLGIIAFSFALGLIRALDLDYFAQPFAFEATAHGIEILACVAMLAFAYQHRGDLEFSDLWLFVLLVIASGLVAAEYLSEPFVSVSFAILTAAQMLALVFLWLGLTDVARASSYASDAVFGIGWSFYALPVALGSLCARFPGFAYQQTHLALVVIYALLIAVVLFMRERAPRELRLFADLNPPLSGDRLDLLTSQVNALGKRFGLSDREKEVVVLYAQGRNRAFISSNLFISENTARDHIKSVYKKMRIHNKQALIDAIQKIAL